MLRNQGRFTVLALEIYSQKPSILTGFSVGGGFR